MIHISLKSSKILESPRAWGKIWRHFSTMIIKKTPPHQVSLRLIFQHLLIQIFSCHHPFLKHLRKMKLLPHNSSHRCLLAQETLVTPEHQLQLCTMEKSRPQLMRLSKTELTFTRLKSKIIISLIINQINLIMSIVKTASSMVNIPSCNWNVND